MTLDIGDFDINNQGWFALPFLFAMFISCIVSLIITKVGIKGALSMKTPSRPKLSTSQIPKYLSLGCIIAYTSCNITQFIALCLYISGIDALVPWTTGDSWLWFIGKYIMYPLFIARLFFTFHGTDYEYKWHHFGFIICYSLIILQIIGMYVWSYYYNTDNKQQLFLWTIIVYFTDPAYCIIITYMFLHKLNQLRKHTAAASIHQRLMQTIAKFTILTFIAITSSVVALIIACIRWYFVDATWMWLSSIFVSMDCAISSVAIIYCFTFARELYWKHCIKCDILFKAYILRESENEKVPHLTLHQQRQIQSDTAKTGTQSTKNESTVNHKHDDTTTTVVLDNDSTITV